MPAHRKPKHEKRVPRSMRLLPHINKWLQFQYDFHGNAASRLVEDALTEKYDIKPPTNKGK